MHFESNDSRYGKSVKACSLLLAVLLMCSMLFVGNVGSIEAEASVAKGTVYFDLSDVSSWWCNYNGSAVPAVYFWKGSDVAKTKKLTNLGNNKYSYTFDTTYDGLIVGSCISESDSGWSISGSNNTYQTIDVTDVSEGSTVKVLSELQNGKRNVSVSGGAASVMIPANTKIYVDCRNGNWWINGTSDGTTTLAVWLLDTEGNGKLQLLSLEAEDKMYSFTPEKDCAKLKMYRLDTSVWNEAGGNLDTEPSGTQVHNSSTDLGAPDGWITNYPTDGSSNCIWLNPLSTGDKYGWNSYTPPTVSIGAGNKFTANTGYKNAGFETGYGVGGTTLFPVNAVFYDYFTDYEIENGWRSVYGSDNESSRTYLNRVPYKKLNRYISDLVGTPGGSWTFPMYFGNFFAGDNIDYDTYYYGTLLKNQINGASAQTPWYNPEKQVYTDDNGLFNFSIFANDSNSIASLAGGYTASMQGLVKDNLSGDESQDASKRQLMVADGVEAPYFGDKIVDDGYANKVTAQFPMRVNKTHTGDEKAYDADGAEIPYATYEFNSGGKDTSITSDNVAFTYNDDGTVNAITYGRGSSYELLDAYHALGGNTDFNGGQDHRGFFPFDSKASGSNIAYDYGFGMRLDIPFNLTKDGYIAGTNVEGGSHTPMKFEFEGDDDVWVFIDGKLVLDLGGDHGNAKGEINFADRSSTVYTGIVEANSVPAYGGSNYASRSASAGTASQMEFGDNILPLTDGEYDTSKTHTMTVFYMERGLIESNLKMLFSISPIENQLAVKNTVKADVNNAVKAEVDSDLVNTEFAFKVTDDKATDGHTYNGKGVSEEEITLHYSKPAGAAEAGLGFALKHNQDVKINYGFTVDPTDPSGINVTETIPNTKYVFDTTRVVTDISNNKSIHVASKTQNGAKANNQIETGNFSFSTASTEVNADVNLKVDYLNTVQTGNLTLSKNLYESDGTTTRPDDSTKFTFNVEVTLPGKTSASTLASKLTSSAYETSPGVFELQGGQSVTIEKLPVGAKVKITETAVNGYTTITQNPHTAEITSGGISVAFKNNKDLTTVDAHAEATKTVDGTAMSGSDLRFNFGMTLDETNSSAGARDNVSKASLTAQNDGNGAITFEDITFSKAGTYWYTVQETAGVSSGYELDTKTYKVKFTVTENRSALTAVIEYYESNGSTKISAITFNNTTEAPDVGSLKIKKADSNGNINIEANGTKFKIYKVDAENAEPASGAVAVGGEKAVEREEDFWSVNYSNLEPGWYAIQETKAPSGYELYQGYQWVNVQASDTTPTEYIFKDRAKTHLPKTGGIGIAIFVVVGVALVAVAIILLKPKKKEKTEKSDNKE